MLQEQREGRIAFGSTLDRKLFPLHVPYNRSGNEHRLKGDPHLGPGNYNNHEVNSFANETLKDKDRTKGYSLGARTAKRFPNVNRTRSVPGPGSYKLETSLTIAEPSAKPFGAAAVRFPEITSEANRSPGPGTYEHDVERYRKVEFLGSFGGPQVLRWKNGIPHKNSVDQIFRTRQSKIVTEKDMKKQLYREAYLSLYWK